MQDQVLKTHSSFIRPALHESAYFCMHIKYPHSSNTNTVGLNGNILGQMKGSGGRGGWYGGGCRCCPAHLSKLDKVHN